MFVSEKLAFIELQKTGSSHVRQLLTQLVGGELDGKHNLPSQKVLDSGVPILGSVRNPWSWYVSLWTYGCQKKGVLRQRLTDPARWVPKAGGDQKAKMATLPEGASAERASSFWYADPSNPEAFREWLSLVLAPGARRIVEAGYGRSPIGKCGGLMTFRYFGLFVLNGTVPGPEYGTVEMLNKLDKEKCLVKYFIKNENLEADLLKTLAACGVELTEEQTESVVSARKTNVSARPLSTKEYFDEKSAQLVGEKERFIIEKFGYSNPFDRA